MANAFYNLGKKEIANGSIDLLNDTIIAVLVSSGYAFDADHDYLSTPAANELSGSGYARKTLGTKTLVEDDANDRAEFDAADLAYTAINAGTADALIIAKNSGADATSTLIAYIDEGFPIVTNGSNLDIAWNSEGILWFS